MESKHSKPYFFIPRCYPESYSRGWEGYRTLVLGVFHVCTENGCPFRAECLSDSSHYDESCPAYKGMDEYYRLSNSNEIEIESYLEGEIKFPTYSSITKYLCNVNRHLTEAEKRSLWDSIAYTNFLQNFQGDYDPVPYGGNTELFDGQLPAFKAALDELQPEVLYVIDTAVTDCLRAHIGDFPGLVFVDEDQGWTLPIYRFLYNIKPKAAPDKILASLRSFSRIRDERSRIQKILKCIEKDRNRARLRDAQMTDVLPHIWDRTFENYLYVRLLSASLSEWQSRRLSLILQGLHSCGYTESSDSLIFLTETPRFRLQYQRDGIVVEIAENLKDNQKEQNISYLLARAKGYPCGDNTQWRTERVKEYSQHKDSCQNAIRNFISEFVK